MGGFLAIDVRHVPDWRPEAEVWQPAPVSVQATQKRAPETDADVLVAMRAGDPAALEILYDRHASGLLGLALKMLQDRGEAEDLVHDVFVEAWRNAESFDPERGALSAWLTVRLRSRAIDRIRRRNADPTRIAEAPAVLEDRVGGEGAGLGRGIDRQRAREALGALAAEQRAVVELAYFGGLTFREIGERLEIPVSTAKSRMVAAIRILRERLAEPSGAA